MPVPDYAQDGIVNLVSSVVAGLGGRAPHPPCAVLPPESLVAARSVVLLVLDGLGHEYLERHARGALRRHLRARLTSVFPSTTASAITTFLTAATPAQHGLTGWFTWMRSLGSIVAPLPFRARFGGSTLDRAGVDPGSVFRVPPLFGAIDARSWVVLPEHLVDSCYSRVHAGPAQRLGYDSLESCFGRIAGIVRRARERSYVYAYWPELDALAHEHGVGSRAVAARFAELEAAFAGLLEAVAGSGALVIATADHGLVDTTPQTRIRLEDHPLLAQTLGMPLCGEPRAAYCYVAPGMRERFEAYVGTELAHCAVAVPAATLLADGYLGPGEPHPELSGRVGDYVLLMKENYSLRDSVPGERPHVHVGVHGGLSSAEMYVPLVVAGG